MLLEESVQAIDVDEYGLQERAEGSVIVHGSNKPFDVLRTREPRTLIVKESVPVDERTDDDRPKLWWSTDRFHKPKPAARFRLSAQRAVTLTICFERIPGHFPATF